MRLKDPQEPAHLRSLNRFTPNHHLKRLSYLTPPEHTLRDQKLSTAR